MCVFVYLSVCLSIRVSVCGLWEKYRLSVLDYVKTLLTYLRLYALLFQNIFIKKKVITYLSHNFDILVQIIVKYISYFHLNYLVVCVYQMSQSTLVQYCL